MPLIPDHPSEIVGEPARDEEDGEHLDEIGQRCRVLIRVGGIGIEKSAAIGSQHLDRHLRGHRSLCDRLGFNLLVLHYRVALFVLDLLAGCILLGNLHGEGFSQLAVS